MKLLLLIFIHTTVGLSYSFLMYHSLSAHRYLLPVYLMVSLMAAYLIFEKIKSSKLKFTLFTLLLGGMLSGNFWIYPLGVAQGWDSTLAHLNYYGIRQKMMVYLKNENLDIEQIGSAFPNITPQKYMDLSNNLKAFPLKDLNANKYVLFSNIYNDFNKDEIKLLEKKFKLKKEFHSLGVFIRLYEK